MVIVDGREFRYLRNFFLKTKLFSYILEENFRNFRILISIQVPFQVSLDETSEQGILGILGILNFLGILGI